jgi:hypothetical protein
MTHWPPTHEVAELSTPGRAAQLLPQLPQLATLESVAVSQPRAGEQSAKLLLQVKTQAGVAPVVSHVPPAELVPVVALHEAAQEPQDVSAVSEASQPGWAASQSSLPAAQVNEQTPPLQVGAVVVSMPGRAVQSFLQSPQAVALEVAASQPLVKSESQSLKPEAQAS